MIRIINYHKQKHNLQIINNLYNRYKISKVTPYNNKNKKNNNINNRNIRNNRIFKNINNNNIIRKTLIIKLIQSRENSHNKVFLKY